MNAKSCLYCEHWIFFGGITGSYGDGGECAHIDCAKGFYPKGHRVEPYDDEDLRVWLKTAKHCPYHTPIKVTRP
jgi:hypothetical protein